MSDDSNGTELPQTPATSTAEPFGEFAQVAGGKPVDPAAEAEPSAKGEKPIKPFPVPAVKDCPVVPLGHEKGKVIFAMPEGEIREEAAAKIQLQLRTDIMVCQKGAIFLNNWRDPEGKLDLVLAAQWLVRECRAAGFYDRSRPKRSLGVWPGPDGAVILHRGSEIWTVGGGKKPKIQSIAETLQDRTGPLYVLRPPAPRPAPKAATVADLAWIRSHLDAWRFDAIGDEGLTGADVVAGWIMAAMLGGFAPFRAHLMISAMAGSGKTELLAFVQAVMSALAGEVIDSWTEAGLRADLSGMARPALLDEAEASTTHFGEGPVEQAMNVLRRMSTGNGGNRKQGSSSGESVAQTAVGAVVMAAISLPRLGSADASRMVEIRLLPLSGTDLAPGVKKPELLTSAALAEGVAKAKAIAPAVLSRALAGARRFREDVATLKAAIVRTRKDPRAADPISMLAAGRRLLTADKALTPEEAEDEIAFWAPLLVVREEAGSVANQGEDALGYLMSIEAGIYRSDRRLTLGEIIQMEVKEPQLHAEPLKAYGLRVELFPSKDGRAGPWLLVANRHPALSKIFERSQWPDWNRTLGYLDMLGPEHRTWSADPLHYGVGNKSRARAIPLAPWIQGNAVPAFRPVPLPRSSDPVDFSND